ncbi:MAG: CapA family protein [Anaerolineales bacterium]|nr:MAG: CapA family protein [Anaerolineales bacterium]
MFQNSRPHHRFNLLSSLGIFRQDRHPGSLLFDLPWKFLPALCLTLLSLHSCAIKSENPPEEPELEPSRVAIDTQLAFTTTATPEIRTPTETPLPENLIFGLAPRWLAVGEAALASLPAGTFPGSIQLEAMNPTDGQLKSGQIDLALLPDSAGVFVADTVLALAVPWTSEWEQVSREEAEAILNEASPFVAVIEWPEMSPTLKPLRIDGLHPSQPDYPLRTRWSLHAQPGLEDIALALAQALTGVMGDEPVKLTAVGDIMLARGLGEAIHTGDDPYPFAAVEHLLASAELTLGNLESALGDGGQAEAKGYTFLAPSEAAQTLALAGFDVLSLANNHAMDYGSQTLLHAIDLLQAQGVEVVGAGADASRANAPLYIEINGIKLAFLSFVDVPVEVRGFDTHTWVAAEDKAGVAWADPTRMRAGIESARSAADVVIVLLHSGYEYISTPSPPQQHAARLAIDAGADLVIGHHAHIIQGVEFYGDGVIVYGLGNFAFEDSGVNDSGLMHIWLDHAGVRSLEFVPVTLPQDGRPVPADPVRATAIRSYLYSLTRIVDP